MSQKLKEEKVTRLSLIFFDLKYIKIVLLKSINIFKLFFLLKFSILSRF